MRSFFEITDPDAKQEKTAYDCFTCAHGNEIVIIKHGNRVEDEGGDFCVRCGKLICKGCAEEMQRTLKCVPFERRLEKMESRDRFLRSIG